MGENLVAEVMLHWGGVPSPDRAAQPQKDTRGIEKKNCVVFKCSRPDGMGRFGCYATRPHCRRASVVQSKAQSGSNSQRIPFSSPSPSPQRFRELSSKSDTGPLRSTLPYRLGPLDAPPIIQLPPRRPSLALASLRSFRRRVAPPDAANFEAPPERVINAVF